MTEKLSNEEIADILDMTAEEVEMYQNSAAKKVTAMMKGLNLEPFPDQESLFYWYFKNIEGAFDSAGELN